MIAPFDTVRTEWPERCPRPTEYHGTIRSILNALSNAECWFEETGIATAVLYVDPKFYHEARAVIYHTVPAFVFVDIIPLEI